MAKRRGSGEGTIFQRSRNGKKVWVAQVSVGRDARGRRRRRTLYGKTRGEVQEKLKRIVRDVDDGSVADPGKLRVADLIARFLEHKRDSLSPTTLADYRHRLERQVAPKIGGIALSRLAPVHILDWLSTMEREDVGRRARQMAFDVFRRCLDFGVKIGLISRNPARGIDRPKVEAPEVRSLTAEQAQELLRIAKETAPPWVTAAVALGLCGLRRGEVFGLTWKHVDLDGGEVHIRQSLKETMDRERLIGPVKTRSARRTVPLPSWARAGLFAHRASLGTVPHPTRLVFTTGVDSPIRFSNFVRRQWAPLAIRAGFFEVVMDGKETKRATITFHQLRHTCATLLLASGADIKSAQAVLGHARASHTLDLYADFVPGNVDRAMAGLDALVAHVAHGDATKRTS